MCGFMRLAMLQFETRLQKYIRMGITIFKISFEEVYRRIYSQTKNILWNFRQFIRQHTSPKENFEYSYPLIGVEEMNIKIFFGVL